MSTRVHVPGMLKNVIAPIQVWLLSQGRCVGCGRDLSAGKLSKKKDGTTKIVCDCGRIFISESAKKQGSLIQEKNKKYRRALLEEV